MSLNKDIVDLQTVTYIFAKTCAVASSEYFFIMCGHLQEVWYGLERGSSKAAEYIACLEYPTRGNVCSFPKSYK